MKCEGHLSTFSDVTHNGFEGTFKRIMKLVGWSSIQNIIMKLVNEILPFIHQNIILKHSQYKINIKKYFLV